MSQPRFRPFEGPRAHRERREGRKRRGRREKRRNVREFHRARIPMGLHGRFLDYVRSGPLIETYMARQRMAHSALRKYVSLERVVLMGAFSYLSLSRRVSPTGPRPPRFPLSADRQRPSETIIQYARFYSCVE